jgi:N-acyl-D-aspartate/D-glutamate deacylase
VTPLRKALQGWWTSPVSRAVPSRPKVGLNFHKADRLAAMLDQAIRGGLEVTCDQYPYAAGCTVLGACLPPWAHDGGSSATLKRLEDPAARARMREEIEGPGGGMWQSMVRSATYEGIVISRWLPPEPGGDRRAWLRSLGNGVWTPPTRCSISSGRRG